jgi:dienelactone hydrolase
MSLDSADSVYLGRPCYLGLSRSGGCNPLLWTSERYSRPVVDSMEAALRDLIVRRGARRIVLIGYSGGATIAWLLAERLPATTTVISIAGNLDPAAWVKLHGYSPLDGSLSPMDEPALRPDIRVLHLVAGRDREIPRRLARASAAKLGGEILEYPGFDHHCCWQKIWPQVLAHIASGESASFDTPGSARHSQQTHFSTSDPTVARERN